MNPFGGTPTHTEINAAACGDEMRGALLAAAVRPPAGMVLCKYGSRSVVGTFATVAGKVVLKYYYPRSPLKRLTYGLAGSRALRSWTVGRQLSALGIPTAEPLVFCEWKSAGGLLLDRSFLAVRQVEGRDLATFVAEHAESPVRLAAVAGNLASAFALMARHRVAHGDLKATNIIVGADDAVTFIDLDATETKIPEARWAQARARDVALFTGNWRNQPCAAEAFRGVFED